MSKANVMQDLCQPLQPSQLKIVVGIPAINEQKFIGDVVGKAKEYTDEVLVIDDGSTDDTAHRARVAGATVIGHKANRGAGEATRSCFKEAIKRGADILITIDGDNQHRPEEIPNLIAPILEGEADLVIGSRFLGGQCNAPRYRKLGIRVITWLFNIGSEVKISDAQGCFRAHSARLLDAINITESGFAFSVQVLIQARQKKLRIKEVPTSCIYHSDGSTINPVRHGVSVALAVVKLRLKAVWEESSPEFREIPVMQSLKRRQPKILRYRRKN